VFSIFRSDYQREQVQLMRAEVALCSILLSLSRTERSLGENADADVSRAKARIAHDSAKGYLCALRLDEAQNLFAQEKLEQLAKWFDTDIADRAKPTLVNPIPLGRLQLSNQAEQNGELAVTTPL